MKKSKSVRKKICNKIWVKAINKVFKRISGNALDKGMDMTFFLGHNIDIQLLIPIKDQIKEHQGKI